MVSGEGGGGRGGLRCLLLSPGRLPLLLDCAPQHLDLRSRDESILPERFDPNSKGSFTN